MKIVLDTNVLLISIPKSSPYRHIFDSILTGQNTLVINNEILTEYVEILAKYTSPHVAENIARLLVNLENVVFQETYFKWQLITNDPDDNKFVDCALAGNARFIVTEDKHFQILKTIEFPKVEVIDADSFLELIQK